MRPAVGDRITIDIQPDDPVELVNHRHAVIVAIERTADGPRYVIGHPPAPRRFGPFPASRFVLGWVVAR
jgi:hypothetical protein